MKKSSTFCSFKFRKFRARRKILGSVRLAVWKKVFLIMMMCLAGSGLSLPLAADEFRLDLPSGLERQWPGPDFFACNFEDWQIKDGSLHCLTPAINRYVYFLSGEIEGQSGQFEASFIARINFWPSRPRLRNYLGLRLGIKGKDGDYRQAAVSGQGIDLGLSTDGLLFIGDLESVSSIETQETIKAALKTGVEFKIALAVDSSGYRLELRLFEAQSGRLLDELEESGQEPEKVKGGLALVASLPEVKINPPDFSAGQFNEVKFRGELFQKRPERRLGPVAFTLYTLSNQQLKLRAQLIPDSLMDKSLIALDLKNGQEWVRVAVEKIQPDNSGVLFSIKDWKSEEAVVFRLVALEASGQEADYPPFYGRFSPEPSEAKETRLAVLSGGSEADYPYSRVVAELRELSPDLLFFGGNQVFGRPVSWWQEKVSLAQLKREYLRQWILFGWAFSDLLKERPAILTPDARDYFQLKLWGDGGQAGIEEKTGNPFEAQDKGGFLLPADFVRLVLATQTSHLPDSPAGELGEAGFRPYFCEVNYGCLSLAVLDDRMFKTPPASVYGPEQIRNGWPVNPALEIGKEAKARGASLHGEEQLAFMKRWAEDWSGQIEYKAALSQSLWACLETVPAGTAGDEALFKSPPPSPGEYPSSDEPAADFNSGGWPPAAREEAVKILRKAMAVHLAGSGGPPASLKYGLDRFEEASYAFVPKPLTSAWLVRWLPAPKTRVKGKTLPSPTGNFRDAFGNRLTVKAVANPEASADQSGSNLSSGFGLVRFLPDGKIIVENRSVTASTSLKEAGPIPGWPVVFSVLDNEGRRPAAYLPTLKFKGLDRPLVQIVEEARQEVVYTVRVRGSEFRPPVFRAGNYTIRCGQPGTSSWRELKKISSLPASVKKVMLIDFSQPAPGKPKMHASHLPRQNQ
ncbi:MAG TPA: hypothetical protein PKJ80_00465 [Candidatus Saccharicenans sp.]|nr:hypothetical protein [Candidatus Saccharicenans sp.]